MIYKAIQGLIAHAINTELITQDDVFVVRNQLMDILKLTDWHHNEPLSESLEEILGVIIDYAVQAKIIEGTAVQRDLFDTKIMGIVTPMPHEVNSIFQQKYAESPESATNWYYSFSKNLNYVRAERIAKDLKWTCESEYGTLDITINRSKPEKDPRDIAAAKSQKTVNYPKCQLCAENMGFAGHLTHPARQNLRPVNIEIQGKKWYLQYSPYGYYNEHCIVFNKEHKPMVIDRAVFEKLLDFVEQFPHYIIGSNADLPIVGGSILTHEHFQGGRYDFPMARANIETSFKMKKYPRVSAGILKWAMSVIRLCSDNRNELVSACSDILDTWRGYSDESVGIYAETDNTPHNTITPIARMRDGKYEIDLVLRNNITSEERPLGIFHPNPSLH
ncbi:MAG: UDP-glucose--hexose-1-phosphate uridylyltransferase, partial [Oscillospiraceae bacterium]|nr:UDP-glucose--hexose-1-phosphate uridylyltransferase [Oscillospiraceae bacterium]